MGSRVLAFHRDPALAAAPFPLEALLVFEHRSDAELIRSVHFYGGDGMLTVVQQEFRLRPGDYYRVREPVAASYCNGFALNSSEQLRSMYKWLIKDEDPMWHCILDFLSHSLVTTIMAPRLSLSWNSALLQLPLLAHDLQIVEKAIHNALAKKELLHPPPGFCARFYTENVDSFGKFSSNSSLPRAPALLPSKPQDVQHFKSNFQIASKACLSAQLEVKDQRNENFSECGLAISKNETSTVDWGVDLELGSPHILDLSLSSWGSSGALCSPSIPVKAVSSQESSCTATGNEQFGSNNVAYELKPQLNLDSKGSISFSRYREACENASVSSEIFHPGGAAWNSSEAPMNHNSSDLLWRGFKSSCGSICSSTQRSLISSDESGDSTSEDQRHSFDLNSETTQQMKLQSDKHDWQLPHLSEGNSNTKEQKSDSRRDSDLAAACQPRGPTERLMEITLEELSQYFNMPITEASKELKVGLTVLKKKCRELRIPRWPHRKLKSLDSLIHNIQELAKNTSGRSPSEVMDTIRALEEQRKIMEDSPGLELTDRTKRLRQACFKASYKQRRQEQQLLKVEPYENVHRVAAAMDPYNYVKCGLIDKCTSSLKGTPFSPKMQYTSVQFMQT
ncbi:hypothetical protein O6H91_06G028300 [Diphasiastrum complanatum]|uniref:Uncharacterized protein n=1 Tax=Diphasiastrum complanatum TaxID=34168 RepID=A0ACC2DC19_DIPCM|nr:hypothetical protein O6H91_06G028300 [Diphasiastrum complanatum]